MGKYLKMADVFNGDVKVSNVYGFILYTGSIYDDSTICEHAAAFDNESAVYISNAINSHDELVAEVDRLRSENQSLMKCRMAAREFFNCTVASGGSVKVSSANKAALDDADKASDWLEIELKATADLVKK